jgi:hexosaminidase
MTGARPLLLAAAATILAGCAAQEPAGTDETLQLIPRPGKVGASSGSFSLRPSTRIAARGGDDVRWIGAWLADLLARTAQPGIQIAADDAAAASNVILLEIAPLPGNDDDEGYRLEVSPEKIVVTANAPAGLFYGAVSLWQLATASAPADRAIRIPAVVIDDAPRFAWRGLMLDVARHYLPPTFIKQMLDWMALHKLNVLHWHLTDDQGWRLQIEALPRLTGVGAWRVPAGRATAADIDPATGEPRRYGGFYTPDEVREIVAYAARRHITVVPEIEMPGHAQAAIAAYPELGTGGARPGVSSDWGIHDQLFNVDESTFDALETILAEVLALFPSRYIHVGGDEAVKQRWAASDRVQERLRELGVGTEAELQSWFIKRIERYLRAHGRKLIGWDEILEGGIAPQATVMSWRGVAGAVEAASLGHDAVLAPGPTLYFDHRQSRLGTEPPGRGTVVTLEDVYRFNPVPEKLDRDERRHVLGLQANLWSEHIRTEERLAYMAFPRAAALAEVAWSEPDALDWPDFVGRLPAHFERYRLLELPFATSAFDVRVTATPAGQGGGARVELATQSGRGDVRYTLDGSAVNRESAPYSGPLQVPAGAVLAAATFLDGRRVSRPVRESVDRLTRRRASHELTLCSERLVLSLEDDAPLAGARSVFLVDIMNPCWIWPDADLSAVTRIEAGVGQVPFNFQLGADRDRIELREPATEAGELEVRANGCDGRLIAILPLREAAQADGVSALSQALPRQPEGKTDLCFRFTASALDPLWVLDWVGFAGETGANETGFAGGTGSSETGFARESGRSGAAAR